MSDEQLDDFLRKAAEQYDVPYNPHAWEQMNHRLDQASGQGGFWSRKNHHGAHPTVITGRRPGHWVLRAIPSRCDEFLALSSFYLFGAG